MGIPREERTPKSLQGAIFLREALGGFSTTGVGRPLFFKIALKFHTRGVPENSEWGASGGHGRPGEGRLDFPGQVSELRLLPSFPSFPRENRKCAINSLRTKNPQGLLG